MILNKKMIATAAIAAVIGTMGIASASADVIASWGFESLTVSPTTGSTSQSITSESGTSSSAYIYASHSNASTTWSSPAGNGSTKSFSSNYWSVNDYYEINLAGNYSNLSLAFDATGSNTGPASFSVLVLKTGESTYTSTGSTYTLINNSWSSATPKTGSSYSVDLSLFGSISAIRLVDNGTTAINGSAVATGGTSRIDNVVVTSTPATAPEPATAAALGLGGLALLARRRK